MKFLIADDAGVMRKIISRSLLELGAIPENIVEAENGRQAFDAAQKENFSLIFMDWNMPEMLGIDAVIAIRGAGIQSPIMMVTTEGEKSNLVRAIQAGATNYQVKPFTPEDLKAKITQMVGVITNPVAVTVPDTSTAEAKTKRIDLDSGRIVLE